MQSPPSDDLPWICSIPPAGAVCFTTQAAGCSLPVLREWRPPSAGAGVRAPPNSAQARCGGSPLLRQGPPAGHGGTIMHPCHSPPIYIDTRNAQKLHPFCIFSKTFSCRGEMRMKSKRKRTAACRDDWAKADRNRAAVRREGWERAGRKRATPRTEAGQERTLSSCTQ